MYNKSMPKISYQFLEIYKSFDKERDKTIMQQSMRKEKLRKVELFFITGCYNRLFYKVL